MTNNLNYLSVEEIMLIDDDKATNVFSSYILKKKQYCDILTIHDSAENALNDLKNRIENASTIPTIVFLYLNMPRVNGWEFLEQYETEVLPHLNKHINLYILTTSMNPDDQEKAHNMNSVKGFLKKPLHYEMIDQIIREI